jgi:hypothetical protein
MSALEEPVKIEETLGEHLLVFFPLVLDDDGRVVFVDAESIDPAVGSLVLLCEKADAE